MSLMGYMGEVPAGKVDIPVVADVANTASAVLAADAALNNTTNRGATGPVVFTLPDAFSVVNKEFTFTKLVAQDVTIQAAGTDIIADSIAGGTVINSSPETFAFLVLKSVTTGTGTAKWIIRTGLGTWVSA